MNRRLTELDAAALLQRVAERVPATLRANIVVIGSIATAWAFRDFSGTASVATKDIDLLLRPAVDAVLTAEAIGHELLKDGWQPRFPNGIEPGSAQTADDRLPALRLSPPDGEDEWFVELLAEPPTEQSTRRLWRRFQTEAGVFSLPSFRYRRVAVHDALQTDFGLRVARPANMALAHLLEHAEPDTTPISSLAGGPPRFTKDVGRAVALWWLASQQRVLAGNQWLGHWRGARDALYQKDAAAEIKAAARRGVASIQAPSYLKEAHAIAVASVLAPHGTTVDAFQRAHASLTELVGQL